MLVRMPKRAATLIAVEFDGLIAALGKSPMVFCSRISQETELSSTSDFREIPMRYAMLTAMLMATVSPCFAAPLPDPIEKDTNPTVFLGMTVALGSSDVSKQVGFTAKALSSNAEDEAGCGRREAYLRTM